MAKPRPGEPCSFNGCDRDQFCKTLCRRHYEQQNEGKPLTPIRAKLLQQPDSCLVPACARPPRRKGYCGMHAYRIQVYGGPGGADSWRRADCQVEGCKRRHQSHGYCATHLRRHQLYGSHDGKWMPQRCRTEGCANVSLSPRAKRALGRCTTCFLADWITSYVDGETAAKRNPAGYEYLSLNKHNYAVHRLVMERLLGRPLEPFETPHHKNGIRHDNRPDNLELWTVPQPSGQRPEDLVAWVVQFYPDLVAAELKARKRELRSGQLRIS